MRAKTYALSLAGFGMGLFLLVVAANVIIDPQALFHTGVVDHPNVNDRYRTLQAYRADPSKYDGVLFGSSRAAALSTDDLARGLKVDAVARFSVVGGMMTDHLPALEYVLRDKAGRGERLRAVFLLFDVDILGRRPLTNEDLQKLQPPALSGQNPARFWWKNITAIQFKGWEDALKGAWRKAHPDRSSGVSPAGRDAESLAERSGRLATSQAAAAEPTRAPQQAHDGGDVTRERISKRYYFHQQLDMLRRFVTLCRKNNLTLVIAMPPILPAVRRELDVADLTDVVRQVRGMIPVWDFTDPGPTASDPKYWKDGVHFKPALGRVMTARIFGQPVEPEWKTFGVPPAQQEQAAK